MSNMLYGPIPKIITEVIPDKHPVQKPTLLKPPKKLSPIKPIENPLKRQVTYHMDSGSENVLQRSLIKAAVAKNVKGRRNSIMPLRK